MIAFVKNKNKKPTETLYILPSFSISFSVRPGRCRRLLIRPTNDIALLIMSSLPSKIRRDNQQKLLDLYYTELKQNLAKISIDLEVTLHYSKEKLLEDYK